MRSAPGVCCVLLTVVAGFIPAVQADTPPVGTGPLYTVEALRAFELFGIHLGMKREEARKALAAAGLKLRFRFPEDLEQDVMGEQYDVPGSDRPGSFRSFSVDYKRWPGRVRTVSGFSYDRAFPPEDAPDLQQRRVDLVKRFGPPSYWKQYPDLRGGMVYSAAYVPLTSLVDEQARSEATSCMSRWECLEGQERADCRKKMKGSRVPIVQFDLLPQLEHYSVTDYEAEYAELSRAPGFHGRQAEALCPIPRVTDARQSQLCRVAKALPVFFAE
jgi:hypothetical protein